MTFPSWREWLHSCKSLLAALLALYIALAIPLDNPYWSMATVYVVFSPLSGATRSKALYRVLGTLLGAAASVLLLPIFSQQPLMVSIVTGLWVGCLLFLSLLDRSPRSYIFMLAAYTVPLIMLSQVESPGNIFAVALARSEEILLGIVCASLVNALLWPGRVAPVIGAKMDILLKDARTWSHKLFQGELDQSSRQNALKQLLGDVLLLDGLILQMGYDSTYHLATRHAREFRARMAMLMPQLMALADPLHALRNSVKEPPTELNELLYAIDHWIQNSPGCDSAAQLRERSRRLEAWLNEQQSTPQQLLISSILDNCRALIDLWDDGLQLRLRFAQNAPEQAPPLRYRVRQMVGRPQHYDFGLLAFSAASVGLSVLCITLIWSFSDWEYGYTAVFMTAVVGCFFASQDDPAPFILDFLIWSAVSCVVAGLYLFVLLPNVRDFGSLAIVLSLPLLLIGSVGSRPQFAATVMLLAVQSISNMTITDSYHANFQIYGDICAATILGLIFALTWARISKPFGLEWAALRLTRSGWKDLALLASTNRLDAPDKVAARVIDRTGQLLPRLGHVRDAQLALTDSSRDLRVCFLLQALRHQPSTPELHAIFQSLQQYYNACAAARQQLPSPEALKEQIETALAQPLYTPTDRKTAEHLMGLYLALYPQAAAIEPAPSEARA